MSSSPDFAAGQVDVEQGIELMEHDINVVRTDAGRNDRKSLATELPGMGDEFSGLHPHFHAVELPAHLSHPFGIPDGDDGLSYLSG